MSDRKPGRPRRNPDARMETVMTIRFSRDERAAIAAAAEQAGTSASEWARDVLIAATKS